MLKRDELSNPNSCMSRAKEDEMTFVLLGRDHAAPLAIEAWIEERIRLGKNKREDAQIVEAEAAIDAILQAQGRTRESLPVVAFRPISEMPKQVGTSGEA